LGWYSAQPFHTPARLGETFVAEPPPLLSDDDILLAELIGRALREVGDRRFKVVLRAWWGAGPGLQHIPRGERMQSAGAALGLQKSRTYRLRQEAEQAVERWFRRQLEDVAA
jgi:hypothetical protein